MTPSWIPRTLMKLYPRDLRRRHGAEMEDAMAHRMASLSGGPVRRTLRGIRFFVSDALAARRLGGGSTPPGGDPRSSGTRSFLDSFLIDGKYAARRLVKTPLFTAVAALSLGLGIGANSAAFSVVNSILFRTFPAEDPESLVDVFTSDSGGFEYATSSYLDLVDLRAQNDVFSDVAGARTFFAQAGPADAPRLVIGELVTGSYFPMLGTRARAGRLIGDDDDVQAGGHPVAVLGHAFWQDAYGGSPTAIGTEVRVNQRPYTVIGIAPESFNGTFPGLRADLWIPMAMTDAVMGATNSGQLENRGSRSMFLKARLLPGITADQAHASVRALSTRWSEELPETNENRLMSVIPTTGVSINPAVDRYLAPVAVLLLAIVGLVLLVACTNLAGFLLARAEERRAEIGVRLALGATRANLIRQLLLESILLSLLGGVVGWMLATWTLDLIVGFQPPTPIPINLDLQIDGRVLAWAAFISLGAAMLFGLAPALQASKPELVSALKGGESLLKGRRIALRDVMIVAQVSLSMVLLVGASLFLTSLQRAQRTDPGFHTGPAAVLWPNFELSGYSSEDANAIQDELTLRLAAAPGVSGVALSDWLPLGLGVQTANVEIPGQPASPDRPEHDIDYANVSPSYHEVMGVPIVSGRAFTESDQDDAYPVAVVSEAFAERFWPGDDAVGRQILVSGREREIVGVARTTKVRTLGESPRAHLYLPHDRARPMGYQFVIRGSGTSSQLLAEARRVFDEIAPDVVLMETKTMEEHLALMLYPPRAAALMLSLFGGLALLLAAIGLYGIVSFAVSKRTREVGIRVSLGATRSRVTRLLVSSGMRLVLVGAGIGLVAALGVSTMLTRFLYGTEVRTLESFVLVPVLLAGVALGAAYLSARRAGRIDPIEALRGE